MKNYQRTYKVFVEHGECVESHDVLALDVERDENGVSFTVADVTVFYVSHSRFVAYRLVKSEEVSND